MKYFARYRFVFLPLLLLLLCSCASSERMLRLSGSVAAPPKSTRLSAAKWNSPGQITRPLRLDSDLVNLWPIYYRNNDYTSAFWPMFDYDRYGLAIRPFFNREGDDYSILFPLMAWNPAQGDGWSAFAYWRKQSFGAFPLFHIGPEVKYVLPVWYRNHGLYRQLITPLGGMSWDEDASSGIWGPVWWDSDSERHAILPFYYSSLKTKFVFPLFYYNPESVKETPCFSHYCYYAIN